MSRARYCPICRRPLPENAETPLLRRFCSERCADVDLARWLTEGYAIAAVEEESDGSAASGDPEETPVSRH